MAVKVHKGPVIKLYTMSGDRETCSVIQNQWNIDREEEWRQRRWIRTWDQTTKPHVLHEGLSQTSSFKSSHSKFRRQNLRKNLLTHITYESSYLKQQPTLSLVSFRSLFCEDFYSVRMMTRGSFLKQSGKFNLAWEATTSLTGPKFGPYAKSQ